MTKTLQEQIRKEQERQERAVQQLEATAQQHRQVSKSVHIQKQATGKQSQQDDRKEN